VNPLSGRQIVLYAVAVAVAVGGVVSQYIIPASWFPGGWGGFVLNLFIVYGLGLLAFFLAFGFRPLRNYVKRPGLAAKEGFRCYGTFTVLGIVLAVALGIIYLIFDASRYLNLIDQSTPVIREGQAFPLFYILFSILFVGFIEETLFRGYVLGALLTIVGTKNWRIHAVWTSILFAGVHIYYAQTYLEVSPIYYVELVMLAIAFSYTYVLSGGNLLMIGILHGAFDGIAFFRLTQYGSTWGLALYYGLLAACALWALYLYWVQGFKRDSWDGAHEVSPADWPPLPRTPPVAPAPVDQLPPPPG
jgi:membrane protease YdiL (CAAX protease family)